jgi:ABC-type phosphate/phosphonate transport system substrate-binding protein
MHTAITRITFVFLTMMISQTVYAAYVFTAPPRETLEEGVKVYQPIADFLTRMTGKQFVYQQQRSWDDYVKGMRSENYDLVFDGPHFVDWRIHNIEHETLIKIPHLLQWRVIAAKGDKEITKLEDLVGRKTCAPGSPNFGMLNLFSHFQDADKQPVHVEVKGWKNVYEGILNGDCVAGVLPKKNHEIYDSQQLHSKAIHTHLPYPNQAMTASKRIPQELKQKIRAALLSKEGQQALENLRKRYTGGSRLVSAVDEEYDSIHSLLIKAKNFSYQHDREAESVYQLVAH